MNEAHRHLFLVPAAGAVRRGTDPRSDDELMLLARGGKDEAFDALVRRHQARVLRVTARLLGRVAATPDVAQEAFLEIYRALPRYRPQGRFWAYLYRVVLNRCRVAGRELRRAPRDPSDPANVPDATSGEEEILARERRREVESALERLSEKLRVVVVLRHSAGLSYEEIADTLAVPVGTVKRRLFDAMEKLRRMLEAP